MAQIQANRDETLGRSSPDHAGRAKSDHLPGLEQGHAALEDKSSHFSSRIGRRERVKLNRLGSAQQALGRCPMGAGHPGAWNRASAGAAGAPAVISIGGGWGTSPAPASPVESVGRPRSFGCRRRGVPRAACAQAHDRLAGEPRRPRPPAFTVPQASVDMIQPGRRHRVVGPAAGGLMLRKSNSARTEKGAADSTKDSAGGSRSWAAMRARLRHGREPIFEATADEPPPARSVSTEARKDASAAQPFGRANGEARKPPEGHDGLAAKGQEARAREPGELVANRADPDRGQEPDPGGRRPAAPRPGPSAAARAKAADPAEQRRMPAARRGPAHRPGSVPSGRPRPTPAPVSAGSSRSRVRWSGASSKHRPSSTVQIGAVVRLQGASARSFGVITTLKNDGRRGVEDDRRLVEIRLLGEILNAGPHRWRFQRGVSSHPALGQRDPRREPRGAVRDLCAARGPDRAPRHAQARLRSAGVRDHRQSAGQALRGARHHGRRQVLRGDRDPAGDPGRPSLRPHHHAGPAQRVPLRVRRPRRAARSEQPEAAVLAFEFRGDRGHPGQSGVRPPRPTPRARS